MSKAKRWVFTSYDVDSEPVFDDSRHEYLVFGRESCPETSRRHLQGYIVFKNRTTLAGLKRWRPRDHFERARGTPQECSDYCKKDNDYAEYGCLPTTTGRTSKFGDVLAAAENGDIERIKADYPAMYIRYKANILSSIKFDVSKLSESCGVWICGPPRCGKDYSVRKLNSLYPKNLNKWWDGYRNEENVLISDVEPSHASWLGYYLKIWSDIYPFMAEIKGGSMLIRPKKIFVTSNFKMEEVFTGQVLAALQCRFTVYDLFGDTPVVSKRVNPPPNETVYQLLVDHGDVQAENSASERPDVSPPQAGTSTAEAAGSPPASPCAKQRKVSSEEV